MSRVSAGDSEPGSISSGKSHGQPIMAATEHLVVPELLWCFWCSRNVIGRLADRFRKHPNFSFAQGYPKCRISLFDQQKTPREILIITKHMNGRLAKAAKNDIVSIRYERVISSWNTKSQCRMKQIYSTP